MTAIRLATADDCEALAEVCVASLRESYPGLVPQTALDGLSVPVITNEWRKNIQKCPPDVIYVAEDAHGCVGFVAGAPCRGKALGQEKEVYAIYLLAAAKRQGTGRRLVSKLATDSIAQGANSAGVWVIRDNYPARRFYEKLGGQLAAEKTENRDGFDIAEVGYIWPGIRCLANLG